MLGDETLKALNTFGDRVVIDSKKNLKRRNKVSSGRLINSINYKSKVSKNSFELSFEMEQYGLFVDAGVEGIGGTKKDGSKWKIKRVTKSSLFGKKLSYKGNMKSSGGRFLQSLGGWTIKRGIAPRDKDGKFMKRKSLIFAIRKSIFHTGIESTKFFVTPFEKGFKKLPEELVEAYALDAENLLKFAVK